MYSTENSVSPCASVRLPIFIVAALLICCWIVTAQDASVEESIQERLSSTSPSTSQPTSGPTTQSVEALRAAYRLPPDQWPAAEIDPSVTHIELGLLPKIEHPKDNPYSKEKADLGRELFFEPKLSGSGQFACASCHVAELGWSDGQTLSFGHDRKITRRNAPPIMNAGHRKTLFWDGRASSLEEQAMEPITSDKEMNGDPEVVVKRLAENPKHVKAFKDAFGDEVITIQRVAQALATFQRTVNGGRSRFDQFLRGRSEALSDSAVRGLHLFRTKAGCINCHQGPNFTDNKFHDVGLSYYGRKLQDLGRYEVSKRAEDVGAFMTPSLRNIERTGPYMHNGLFEMDGVLNLYNAGMPTLKRKPGQEDDPLFPTKSPLLKRLNLTVQERDDLKAFLFSLTEPKQRIRQVDD